MFRLLTLLTLAVCWIDARPFNDTGNGTIIFEEAWTTPSLLSQTNAAPPIGQTEQELLDNLLDIHNQRLAHMDATGVDFMVLSCASPCIQGIADADNASATAIETNNVLAESISNNTMRFGAFAALSMIDPAAAAAELNRTVVELGFLGALVNDFQESGPAGNEMFLFYDQPEYDVFWQMVVDLDVPVYFHPRINVAPVSTLMWTHAPFLRGPSQEFAVTLSTHILGLCVNGVFDRFPDLKIIVGHLGERVASDIWRINDQLQRQIPEGLPMKNNVTFYLQKNIFETTSGNFAKDLFEFHVGQIGASQILYSVDYPFVPMEQGQAWLEDEMSAVLSNDELVALKRGRAIELLGLNR